ncbi:MAG: sulfatase, partial [Myxococcota bacterium]
MLLLVLGCFTDRVAAVGDDLARLEADVVALREERAFLQRVLDETPPPTLSERMDLSPRDADPDATLPPGHPRRPDVILLSIDTLRADHLGSYGYPRDTSPFFDRLASEGARFSEAWAPAPWTLPSHATMLSGLLPEHHGAIEDHLRVPPDVDFVSTAFQRAGYRTAAIVATLFVSSRYGFDRGFDHFEDFGIREKKENHLSLVDADHVFAHARHFTQTQGRGRPVFLFLHVYDVHYGYDPPPPHNEHFDRPPEWGDEKYRSYHTYLRRMIDAEQLEHQIAQYDEEIRFVDHAFEQLVSSFRAAGRDVVVAVTADHGEEFGERGSWGHGHTLFPEQLHVPWILHGPGVRPGVIDTRVGLEDIAPTLASLAGVRFGRSDGTSRAGLARGRRASKGRPAAQLASTSRFQSHVLRWHEPPWDLYVDVPHKTRILCDRSRDPGCRTNVYRLNPETGQRLFG